MSGKIAFGLFVLGALLFAAAITSPFAGNLDVDYRTWPFITLFGLPYVLREFTRRINWLVILYLILLVPACYFAAQTAAISVWSLTNGGSVTNTPGVTLPAGLAGGLVGSALSFLALRLPGLRADDEPPVPTGAGIGVLTVLGGLGLALADMEATWSMVLWLFLPWQIVFAYFLSQLLKPSPPRSAPAA